MLRVCVCGVCVRVSSLRDKPPCATSSQAKVKQQQQQRRRQRMDVRVVANLTGRRAAHTTTGVVALLHVVLLYI